MSERMQTVVGLYRSGRLEEALTAVAPLVSVDAEPSLELLLIAGQASARTERYRDAASFYERAAVLAGDKAPMLRALVAEMLSQADDRRAALTVARRNVKTGPFARDAVSSFRTMLHDYFCIEEKRIEDQSMLDRMRRGDARYLGVEHPLFSVSWCDDEAVNARLTHGSDGGFTAESRRARRAYAHRFADRIRVGYLSNDVSDAHPTMRLFQGVLDHHDRSRFDVVIYCWTEKHLTAEDSGMRRRFRNIVSIGALSDADAAALIRRHEIDVLVDLKGHTKGMRPGILNDGAAPIQVAYLGFPGSGNGIDCDYVIGDPIVLPETSRAHYHEKFCLLPHSYQANDDRYRPLPPPSSRAELGLPEDRVVFASFNAARKITPRTADLWAAILNNVPDSILWMLCEGDFARQNLTTWMKQQGVAAERIIFAAPAGYAAHIARLQAADIALDSFPYNGHTSTSDALWAGLPVPTFPGGHFASRVTASLLTALGMPDLIATDAKAYVALTSRLARDRELRAATRARIAQNRRTTPLFDTRLFTRHIESAFDTMVSRARQGLEPQHFAVTDLSV